MVLKTCLLGELLIDWKAPPQSALKLNGEGGCWGQSQTPPRAYPHPPTLPEQPAWASWWQSASLGAG